MITFEEAKDLEEGDALFQHMEWKDGQLVSWSEWQVLYKTPYTLKIQEIYSDKVRTLRSVDFPLQHWSLERE